LYLVISLFICFFLHYLSFMLQLIFRIQYLLQPEGAASAGKGKLPRLCLTEDSILVAGLFIHQHYPGSLLTQPALLDITNLYQHNESTEVAKLCPNTDILSVIGKSSTVWFVMALVIW
jgi:hypothetical protein